MKRQISILACLLMLLAVVFAVASCTQPEAAHVHEYVETVTKEATCTDKGEVTLTCSCGDKYTNETAAKGHNVVTLEAVEPTCVTAGKTEGQQCADCGLIVVAQSTVAAKGHKLGAAATCTTAQTCEYGCGQVFVEALGHNAPAPTCTEDSVCKRCGEKQADALGHKAPEATCTEDAVCTVCLDVVEEALGHIGESDCYTGWCTRCYEAMVYGNDNHEYNYACDMMCNKCYNVTNWEANHNMIEVAAKESTCTVNGNVKYFYCEYCNYCEDEDGNFTNMMNVKLDLAPHEYWTPCDGRCMNCYEITNPEAACSLIHVEALDPTCTEMGNKEYWYCEYCNACWENADGSGFQSNYRMLMLPALGHKYNYDCDEICYVCGEITREDAEHLPDHVDAVAPTCTKTGCIEHDVCEYCLMIWDADGNVVNTAVIPALGHKYANKCDPVCLVCYDINTEAAHNVVKVTKKAETCTTDGAKIDYWTCTYCELCWVNEELTANTNKANVVIPAPGHKGHEEDFKCDVCNKVVRPAAGTTLTIKQANALAAAMGNTYTTEKYYVTGWVTSVDNTTYGNLYITDESNDVFYIYGLYSSNGSTRYDKMSSKPVKADEITVYTVVGCYYGAPQGKNAWLDELIKHTTHNWADATCSDPMTCVRCGVTDGDPIDHNYVDGVCTECGSKEGAVAKYVKVTSKDQFTTGTYVLVAGGKVLGNFSSGWVLAGSSTISGNEVTDPAGATWTLTVSGTSVTIKDAAGTFIKPKSGNNNGIQSGSYNWAWTWNSNGTVTFAGTGSDTTKLALNKSEGKFRAYKNNTISGNSSSYPCQFTVYKLTNG